MSKQSCTQKRRGKLCKILIEAQIHSALGPMVSQRQPPNSIKKIIHNKLSDIPVSTFQVDFSDNQKIAKIYVCDKKTYETDDEYNFVKSAAGEPFVYVSRVGCYIFEDHTTIQSETGVIIVQIHWWALQFK